jgi:hypothetical protein
MKTLALCSMFAVALFTGILPGSSGCMTMLLGNSCCCVAKVEATAAPVKSCCSKHAPKDSTEAENLRTRCLTHPQPCCPSKPAAEAVVAADSFCAAAMELPAPDIAFDLTSALSANLAEVAAANAYLCGPPLQPPDTPLFLETRSLLI